MKDFTFVVLFISKDVFFFPLVKDKAVQWWIYIIYTIYSPKLISLKGLIAGTLQWKTLYCLHLMEAFITKTTCSLSWGKIKKFKICSRRNNKMQCLCSNAPLHIKPKQNFYCVLFFLDTFYTCKTSLISLESFFYWVIKLNAFNFQCTALLQPFKFKQLLTEPEIITRLDECVVFQNCETNCRHTVKQSPIYATPPPSIGSSLSTYCLPWSFFSYAFVL